MPEDVVLRREAASELASGGPHLELHAAETAGLLWRQTQPGHFEKLRPEFLPLHQIRSSRFSADRNRHASDGVATVPQAPTKIKAMDTKSDEGGGFPGEM